MKILEQALQDALGKIPEQLLSEIIAEKLAAQGIKLSQRERRRICRSLMESDSDVFEFRAWRWRHAQEVVLELTDADCQDLERRFDVFLEGELPRLIRYATTDLSVRILDDLKRRWSPESRRQERNSSKFRRRLKRRWKQPLGLLRMLLTISREFGASTNAELRESHDGREDHLVEVLTRLHARACQITEEVVCLLEAGLADGALARWRTLHEVAVVAILLREHGDDLAKRYLAHDAVESYRAAKDYASCQARLGYEPITVAELAATKAAHDAAIAAFGSDFKGQYGWATTYLGKSVRTFRQLEDAAAIEHLRAHYHMASHPVHANPKGVFFKLGLLRESEVLLAGPSDAGLTDPGHCTAISLLQVSAALGTIRPTVDDLVVLRIMERLEREIGQAFLGADERAQE